MKRRILSIILCAAIVCAALFATSCSENKEQTKGGKTKITFVLDWTPNTNHTGLYVAQEKGYFSEEGFEVEIVQPSKSTAEVLVGSGKAQFGVSFQDTMASAITGDEAMPITAVAAVLQHNTSGIISRKGEGIDSPKGLEGKKYATWNMPIEQATLRQVMKDDGGDFSKVELIPENVTDEVSALRSKKIDAIWVYYGWAGIATEVAKLDTDYFAFRDINEVFDYYTPVIIGNNNWLTENPDKAKAFLRAVKKGYEYSVENPDAAADLLCKAVPELDKKLTKASQKFMSEQYKAEVEKWGYIDSTRWNAFYKWINDNNLSEEKLSENQGFTNDYLD